MTIKYPFHYHRSNTITSQQTFFWSNQSDLIIWSFMPWILHCFLQWPSFSFLFEDRWVLVVRMMHPQLATEPYRFFSRAWTRRSCFETWNEERHQQLTQLTNGPAKKECPECLMNGWPSRDAVVMWHAEKVQHLQIRIWSDKHPKVLEGCTLGYGIFYAHLLELQNLVRRPPFPHCQTNWSMRAWELSNALGSTPHRLQKQKLKS